jgi:hypothetical protein
MKITISWRENLAWLVLFAVLAKLVLLFDMMMMLLFWSQSRERIAFKQMHSF